MANGCYPRGGRLQWVDSCQLPAARRSANDSNQPEAGFLLSSPNSVQPNTPDHLPGPSIGRDRCASSRFRTA